MAHIIVVEDEQELARLIASTLKEDGHTIEVYRDGQFALDRIQDASAAEPDLYILDLGLPRIDGLTLCKRIRQNHITPIVMLTAKSSELDKVLGLELGADANNLQGVTAPGIRANRQVHPLIRDKRRHHQVIALTRFIGRGVIVGIHRRVDHIRLPAIEYFDAATDMMADRNKSINLA